MNAHTAGEPPKVDGDVGRVADIGWLLFEMQVEYNYLRYDDENDELTIAHDGGLVLLGPGEGAEALMATSWWQSVVA